MPSDEDQQKLVNSTAAQLAEHFDSVLIIATRKAPTCTERFTGKAGNYFASFGAAKCWVIEEEEDFRESMRRKGDDD